VEELKRRILDSLEGLVNEWIPGARRDGPYMKAGDIHGAEGGSFWVHLKSGTWRDEAVSDKVGDPISLYAEIYCAGDNKLALRELAARFGLLPEGTAPPGALPARAAAPVPPKKPAAKADEEQWLPVHPVPDDAPPYRTQWAHYARGVPPRHWEYRSRTGALLGVVCRFETSDGGKDVQPLAFCISTKGRRQWRYHGFNEPRPLFGLDQLGPPGSPRPELVVVVEGEKSAEALRKMLLANGRQWPVLTWPGGCNAARKADFSALAGLPLLCWPDADAKIDKTSGLLKELEDQPGQKSMRTVEQICTALGCDVQLVDIGAPGDRKDGWDCADAIEEEGWGAEQVLAFMARTQPPLGEEAPAAPPAGVPAAERQSTPPSAARAAGQGGAPAGAASVAIPPPGPGAEAWRKRLIWANEWKLRECVPNVIEVLMNRPEWAGVVGYNEFSDRVVKRSPPPFASAGLALAVPAWAVDEWTDADDTRVTVWITQQERFVPTSTMIHEAVNVVARQNAFHPVREYLAALPKWDGVPRIDLWLADFLHVEPGEYTTLVSRWFLMGMVARVLQPGVKFDYCLVLEGNQGRFKSTALRILAGEWFSDIELDLANKDAMSNIRGKWLHEFGEMGSIARSESTRQKSFLSRQFDEFRPAYGRREVKCARQLVFAGTTNEWRWNKDPTGGRRFWPVDVPAEVNIEGLAGVRDMLFAEALHRVQAGERFYPNGEEQREIFDPEQLSREAPNSYVELLAGWLNDQRNPHDLFTLATAIVEGLKIDAKGISRDIETRVGTALHKLGCEKVEKRTNAIRHWYKRPQRNAASSMPDEAGVPPGEGLPV
jgi:predicted P-loop ATPase